MTLEELINYAMEQGVSKNWITQLVRELHPDELGRLRIEEYSQAVWEINYHIATKKFVEFCLEESKEMRVKRNKTDK